ncbi:conserved Plasmodium protein, unknown function [Plasmodium gallinaceum]|uniref:RNA-binding protein n=1 Tax=Plasmodium gallinaceum TaxID=5849 RepID=A0A1J1GYL7_PLAGA|nr:conserved Plasmodium protein, unknown function [Plasmodium gallinaceum]CRG97666.1 conserved Plasmodium protein, unknown function [Plasmodium gallinaceum]
MLGFVIFNVSAFIKHKLTFINYVVTKTDKYKKKKKKICLFIRKSKNDDIESYIPYIYKDVAPCLKELADEEYSYKDLLNAYFPETIEREKRIKEKKKLEGEKEKEQNTHKELDSNLYDIEKHIEEKLVENNIQNFEHINKIKDGKVKNKILEDSYDIIKSTLEKTYFNRKKEEDTKINYLELAKKEKELLYTKLINGYSIVNNKSTFDFFGVFYDSEDYNNKNKIFLEIEKILNLEPFKSNQGDILQDIDSILKINKIPSTIRNFLIKYRSFGKKIYNMKKNESYKKKEENLTNKEVNYSDDNEINKQKETENKNGDVLKEDDKKENNENIDENKKTEENKKDDAIESSTKIINEEEKEEENLYKQFHKDVNKVIMTMHNNLNDEKLIKKDCFYMDEFYEAYKKHLKNMHIKRNKLEPQKNNYDFLTFMHEHFEDYFFSKYGNFDYDFNDKIKKIKKKIHDEQNFDKLQDMEILNENECFQNKENINNSNNDNVLKEKSEINEHLNTNNSSNSNEKNMFNKKNNYKGENIFKELKENKKLKKYILIDMIKNYHEKIYDIYKPNDLITNAYGFNNYIDIEKHDREIDLTFNKHSILNYDSKDVLNNDEKLYVGKLIFGKIFQVEKNVAYVDINYAFYAEIHIDQMPYNIDNIKHVFNVNDKLIFEIYKMYTNKILLTLKNIQKINDLNKILLYKTEDIPFDVHVNSILKNGISVSYNDIHTFIHTSALSSKYKVKTENEEKILDTLINQKIKVFCTDINKLSFSNIIYEQNEQLKNINIYDVIEADIIHISKYGIMVKFCDIVGLIHVSEISKKRIPNLNNLFKINDKIKGVIINIDYDNKRFSLSTKILESEGKNIIDNKIEIYEDIINIVNNIKKRNSNLKINDSNIKNQLLSLIDIYENDNDSKKSKQDNNMIHEEINKSNQNDKTEEINQNNKLNENDITEDINDCNKLQDDNDKKLNNENMGNESDCSISETDEAKKELFIDVHNQMIPYLMIKLEENSKIGDVEKKKEIIWDLEDENFLNSNSPSQSSQFFEYQWSYLKEKKWINFAYYINKIMNYYFNINDDFFTYKEKNIEYEIDFVKNIRIDLSTGLYTRIRKTVVK